jgi:hypothetical protein
VISYSSGSIVSPKGARPSFFDLFVVLQLMLSKSALEFITHVLCCLVVILYAGDSMITVRPAAAMEQLWGSQRLWMGSHRVRAPSNAH